VVSYCQLLIILWVPFNAVDFSTNCGTTSFSREALLTVLQLLRNGTYQGYEIALFHNIVELPSPLGARLHFTPQQVSSRQVGKAVLRHNLVTLRTLPGSWPTCVKRQGTYQLRLIDRVVLDVLDLQI
jgi:hypothetical protein